MGGGLQVGELYALLGLKKDEFDGGLDAAGGALGKLGPLAAAAGAAVAAALVAAAFKFGAAFDDAYDNIRVKTGATGKTLNALEGDFKAVVSSVPTDFASASDAVASLNQRLGVTGKPLQELSKQFLELSRLTGTDVAENVRLGTRLFGDWSIKSGKQSEALDELFRATQVSGIGLGDLMQTVVEFGAPLRNMGFGFTDSIAMLSKWEREGVNTSTVLTGMKYALKTFAKEGLDPQNALPKYVEKIKAARSATDAMSIGAQVFGLRAGPDMVAAIREGRFQYEDFAKAIGGGSDTVLKAASDTNDWKESLTVLKNQALVALEPALSGFFGLLSKGATALSDLAHSEGARSAFTKIKDVALDVWKTLERAFRAVKPVLVDVFGEISKTVQVWAGWVAAAVRVVVAVFRKIAPAFAFVFRAVLPSLKAFGRVVLDVFHVIIRLLRGDWRGAWDAAKSLLRHAFQLMVEGAKASGKLLLAAVKGLARLAVAALRALPGILLGLGRAMISGLARGAQANISLALGVMRALPGKIKGALGSLGSLLYNAGAALISGLYNGIVSRLSGLLDKVRSMASAIAGAVKGALGVHSPSRVFAEIGDNLMRGLAQGIDRGAAIPRRALGGVADGLSLGAEAGFVGAMAGGGGTVVHEHYHVHVPGGSVLVGTLDEAARLLTPHVTRHQDRVAAQKGRGR